MSSTIITVSHHKGGVAKTQTAVEMAYFLAKAGKKVFFVDTDPQANASNLFLAGNFPSGRMLATIIKDGLTIERQDIMRRSFAGGVTIDFICTNIEASRLEENIKSSPKEFVIKRALKNIQEQYDYIIIDTPRSSGVLALAAFVASDLVLIPATPDRSSIDGVGDLVNIIKCVNENEWLNPDLKIMGILVTIYERTKSDNNGLAELQQRYGDLVVDVKIRKNTRVKQAVDNHRPVQDFDPLCNAAVDYTNAFSSLFNLK